MKKALALFMVLCLTLSFTACGGESSSNTPSTISNLSSTNEEKKTYSDDTDTSSNGIVVGWLQKNMTNVFETVINESGEAVLDQYKSEGVIDDYILLDGNTDPSTQISQAQDLINYGVTVAIIQPAEADGSAPCLEILNEAGIPVIVVNAKTTNTEELAASYVGSYDVDAGEIMGQFILDTCGETGGYAHLQGVLGNSAAMERTEGIHNVMDKAADWTMLDEQSAEWMGDKASKFAQDWISLYGDELDTIVCDNDDMSVAAKLACIEAGREDIVVIGVDAIDSALQMVYTGELDATVFQDGAGQGATAVELAIKAAKGETVEKENWIDFKLVTKENIDEFYTP